LNEANDGISGMGSSVPLGRTLSINSITEVEAKVDEYIETDRRSNSVSEKHNPFLAETRRSLVR
jgi:TATA-binding protein-associated factor Taf7